MFSNDKNIERIADLVVEAKQWLSIRKEYTKLELIDIVVQLSIALALIVILALFIIMILIYLSFSCAYALEPLTKSMSLAFLIVSVIHFILMLAIYFMRHSWIEKPLVRFLVNILLKKNDITDNNQTTAS